MSSSMEKRQCSVCGGAFDAEGYCISLYDGLEMLKAAIEYLKPPVMRVPEGYEGLWLVLFGYTPANEDPAANESTLVREIEDYLSEAGQ